MQNLTDIQKFYESPKGEMAEKAITTALQKLWTPIHQERLVGYGYTIPWLNRFAPDTERTINIMHPELGAIRWSNNKQNATVVATDVDMPLPDSSVDRILMIHGFEYSKNPKSTLQEAWRVLAPAAKIVLVVPNKNNIGWRQMHNNPFAKTPKKWSVGEMRTMLVEAMFETKTWNSALYFPPSDRLSKFAVKCEKIGRKYVKVGGGVIIVEAQKQMLSGVTVTKKQTSRMFVGALKPQGVTTKITSVKRNYRLNKINKIHNQKNHYA